MICSLALIERVRELSHNTAHALQKLLAALPEFDASNEWMANGAASCAHWLAHEMQTELCTARDYLRVAKKLAEFPALADAYRTHDVSYSKVRTLTRYATTENVHELLAIARRVPAAELTREIGRWLAKHEQPEERDRRIRLETRLRCHNNADGTSTVTWTLPTTIAAKTMCAVDAKLMSTRVTRDASADFPSLAQQRADALLSLVAAGGATVGVELIVHLRGYGCTLDDGTPLADHEVARLIDGAFVRALIHGIDGTPIDATFRRRLPTVRQKRVVKETYGACVDCGSHELLTFDHSPGFNVTRRTIVRELVTRCWPCHRNRHRQES